MAIKRGDLINNRYKILEIMGQGGMGTLYRALDENLGVEVALKENLFTTDEYARQFKLEAVLLANLRHENLPRVSDHFVIKDQGQYLVMDYIEGEDLRERMDRIGTLSAHEMIVIGATICDALSYMHAQTPPVLHRDLKPGNVKITPEGKIFLVDFGLAKVAHGTRATTTGARAMTPGYSPPEQYGGARTDERSDVYSLGATLYAAATGFIPEDSLARTMEQDELTPVRKRNPKVSRRLANVIEKTLEVHPDDRYQTAEELKKALRGSRRTTIRREADIGTVPPPTRISDDDLDAVKKGVDLEIGGGPIPVIQSIKSPEPKPGIISKRRKTKSRNGCLISSISLIVLIAVAAFSIFNGIINLPPLVGNFVPGIVTETPPTSETDLIEELIQATETAAAFIPQPTNTPIPTGTPTEAASPQPTPLASSTPTIAPSDEPTPTAQGGGFGEIAFVSDRSGTHQIWLMDADGVNPTQITQMQQGACQPDWSPDGQRLVFISPCDGQSELYPGSSMFIVDIDGTELTPLPTVGGGDFDPSWSPDGSRITFTSLRNGERPQIFVLDLGSYEVTGLSGEYIRDLQPQWSPDGSEIVFITTRNGPYQIWMMNADGSDQRRFSASRELKNTFPIWSPTGQILIFTQSLGEGSIPRLVSVRVADEGLNEYGLNPMDSSVPMREPAFSPDGIWIAFESWPEGANHDIYIMTTNGAELSRITYEDSWEFDPEWRPVTQ